MRLRKRSATMFVSIYRRLLTIVLFAGFAKTKTIRVNKEDRFPHARYPKFASYIYIYIYRGEERGGGGEGRKCLLLNLNQAI